MLLEFLAALGAADHNFSLALGNADLLTALGTLVNVIAFVAPAGIGIALHTVSEIPDAGAKLSKPAADRAPEAAVSDLPGELQIFPVLVVPLGDVPGEHAKIHIDEKQQGKPPQKRKPQDQVEHNQNQDDNGKKLPEFVCAVPALHKLHHLITEAIKHKENLFSNRILLL